MKKPVPGKNKNPGRHLITAIAVAVIIFAVFYLYGSSDRDALE